MTKLASKRRPITGFGITLLVVLGITLFMYFNFTTVIVSGNSMEPMYTDKERVLVSKAYWLVGGIRRKDVVVLRGSNGETVIKRVIGLPGDTIDFFNVPEDWKLQNGEYVVPPNAYYVLGDNREVSEDSRKFGPVPEKQIVGKVLAQR